MMDASVKTYSRAIGILLILSIAGGFFGEMYVPSWMMADDAASTAAQLRTNESLFRLGFAAYLVEAVSDIALAWLFYVLLKPVHRDLALLSAFFGLVSTTLFAVTKMFYFAAPMFVRDSQYLTAFPPEQLDAFATLFLSLYGVLSGLTMLFYGIPWIIRGYLTYKSGYLPGLLGLLMVVAGVGFVVKTATYVLVPDYSSDLWLAPMFFNALAVTVWMLVRGVDQDNWAAAQRDRSGPPSSSIRG
jgi:glucan phosphoethanolaminetransferase (alkaline phosphatase superfamily)